MRTRVLLVAALLTATTLSGCGGGDDKGRESPQGAAPQSGSAGPAALPLGKSVFPIEPATEYVSPRGFAPEVRFQTGSDGWISTHRSADAFDLGLPLPDVDAPLEVIAFVVPAEASADEALQAIADRAEQAGATVVREGDFTVTDGDGPLILSRDHSIELDAVPGGLVRVTTEETVHGPVLRVLWVPDSANLSLADAPENSIASTIQAS